MLSSPRSAKEDSSHSPDLLQSTPDVNVGFQEEQASVPIPESLPQSFNGFDWSEDYEAKQLSTDGMAVLAVNPQGVGYLGSKKQFARVTLLSRA